MTGIHVRVKNRQRKGLNRSPCCGLSGAVFSGCRPKHQNDRRTVCARASLPGLPRKAPKISRNHIRKLVRPLRLAAVAPVRPTRPFVLAAFHVRHRYASACVSTRGECPPVTPRPKAEVHPGAFVLCAPRCDPCGSGRCVVATPRDKQKHGCHCKCAVADDVSANRNKCRSERYRTSGSWTCDAGHKRL